VRWRACDLIMRLHEEFGFSVSDDTIYRALKDLGFSPRIPEISQS
jgi:transposase